MFTFLLPYSSNEPQYFKEVCLEVVLARISLKFSDDGILLVKGTTCTVDCCAA